MEIAKFGNWGLSAFGIEWKGREDVVYHLPLQTLVHTGFDKKSILYEWLIEIARDERLTSEDIYSLNTAFFYSLDLFRTELDIPNYVLVAETLKAQQDLIDERKLVLVNSRIM
ncbi:MAG TPA: hypothetical protein VG603_03510 [Chitinophagales bacterium]|nr:hypothetical protein [Chitinophagales bacterium]